MSIELLWVLSMTGEWSDLSGGDLWFDGPVKLYIKRAEDFEIATKHLVGLSPSLMSEFTLDWGSAIVTSHGHFRDVKLVAKQSINLQGSGGPADYYRSAELHFSMRQIEVWQPESDTP